MRTEIEINLNSSQIIDELGLGEKGTVTEKFRNIADRFMDSYIPFQSGILKNNKRYPDKDTILYLSPYAHYHYIGKKAVGPSRPKGIKRTISNENMNYSGAPKRGPRWAERMMNDRGQEIINELERYING